MKFKYIYYNSYCSKKCNKYTDCPSYSNTCYIPSLQENQDDYKGVCSIYYICHDNGEKCYILNEEEFDTNEITDKSFNHPFYKITNQEKEKLILTTCSRESIKNHKCSTEFCFKHSDCFSNKCYLGDCETNEQNKTYICSLNNDMVQMNDFTYTVSCGLAKQEKCERNEDCFTGICDTETSQCADFNEKGLLVNKNPKPKNFFSMISIIIIITIFAIIVIFSIFCCCKVSEHSHIDLESVDSLSIKF